MARVTVEDCVDKVQNRFELLLLAAHRARAISSGDSLTIDRDDDKNPVVALREIAEESIEIEKLSQSVIQSLQTHVEIDEPEEDELGLTMPLPGWGEAGASEADLEAEGSGMSIEGGPELKVAESGEDSGEE